jgi:hypothetical protein
MFASNNKRTNNETVRNGKVEVQGICTRNDGLRLKIDL